MRAVLFGVACSLFVGCGGDLASVSGSITLDGQPLAGSERLRGTVQFSQEDGHGTTAVGYLDGNGHYDLSSGSRVGVLPGKYLVSVSATEIIPPKTPGEAPSGRLATPRRYAEAKSSGFTAEVVRGRNTFDYVLSSQNNR
jgi:hypothetical protein